MEAENINLVIVTSVVQPFLPSLYNSEERFRQLTELTIPSVQRKIPNAYLVVVEGSKISIDQKEKLKNLGINELLYFDVQGYDKSYGETTLIVKYLESNFFKNLANNKNIITISKLSGRYYLTDDYDFNSAPIDKVLIKKTDCSDWSKQGICDTRYYRFPYSCLNRYYTLMKDILNKTGIYIDLEHSFYHYQIFEFDKIANIAKINLAGNLAPDGQTIFD